MPSADDHIDVLVERVVEIGMERSPHEACGIIAPEEFTLPRDWVIELPNVCEEPLSGYVIHMETIRILGLKDEVLSRSVVWHTHPRGNIGPSKADLETRLEGLDYLVVALPGGEAVRY